MVAIITVVFFVVPNTREVSTPAVDIVLEGARGNDSALVTGDSFLQ